MYYAFSLQNVEDIVSVIRQWDLVTAIYVLRRHHYLEWMDFDTDTHGGVQGKRLEGSGEFAEHVT
jgi:hypothetical protein